MMRLTFRLQARPRSRFCLHLYIIGSACLSRAVRDMRVFTFRSFVPLFLKVYIALVPLFVAILLNLDGYSLMSAVLNGSVLASAFLWASIYIFKILKPSYPNLVFAALGLAWYILCGVV